MANALPGFLFPSHGNHHGLQARSERGAALDAPSRVCQPHDDPVFSMHSEEQRGETRAGPRLRPREWGRAVGPSLPRVRSPHGLELPGENKQGMPGRWQNLSQSDVKSRFAVCLLLTWSVSPTFKIDSKSGRMFQRREQDRARGASARLAHLPRKPRG